MNAMETPSSYATVTIRRNDGVMIDCNISRRMLKSQYYFRRYVQHVARRQVTYTELEQIASAAKPFYPPTH